jgi:hypothetical protein
MPVPCFAAPFGRREDCGTTQASIYNTSRTVDNTAPTGHMRVPETAPFPAPTPSARGPRRGPRKILLRSEFGCTNTREDSAASAATDDAALVAASLDATIPLGTDSWHRAPYSMSRSTLARSIRADTNSA